MRRLALAPLLLAAAACGSDAATVGAPTAVTTTTTTPAAPRATTPAAAKPARTKPAPPAKAPATTASPAPAKPAPVHAKAGDVDGDGRADTVWIAERKDSLATGVWDLRVSLGAGTTVTGVVTAEPQVRPAVLGVVDADRDSDGEVFVRVGGGASTTSYTPYTLVEDGLAEVRTVDGKPLRLLVGGSVTHGDGFACADLPGTAGRELLTLSVVADASGETFRGTRVTYRWRDDQVVELSRQTFGGRQGDPAVEAAYEIDCDGLGTP